MKTKRLNILFPLLISLILGIVYTLTIAPGLSWANRGADGGDFITAAATGGVAHPTGYPTYLALAWFFQQLPLGNLAFRTNLMSAFFAILTALFVADLVRCSFSGSEQNTRWAGFLAGLAFGLSQLFWSQALITEVYTLNAFFVILLLWLSLAALKPEQHVFFKPVWLERLGGLIFGLALGNQITVVFLLPVWLLFGTRRLTEGQALQKRNSFIHPQQINWPGLARRVGWLCIGLLIYATIPLRARSGSPVNWGYAIDWDGFWWLISGGNYQGRVFNLPAEYLWPRIRNWAGWLQTQFGIIGLTIGFYGLLYGTPRVKRYYWITGWIFLAYSIFSVGYDSSDSYALLIPAYLVFAIWIGLGVGKLLEEVEKLPRKAWLYPLVITLTLGVILVNTGLLYPQVDASRDKRAEIFAQTVLATAPPHAIIFTSDDEDVFALRYYTYALGQRPDIAIFSGALQFGWYQEVMRYTYPDLVIPIAADDCLACTRSVLITTNRERPICESYPFETDVLVCEP
ncbi:MAG: DUF2723 domain-containing protein [Chloroflexi bacterium]|jgi:hypothetical protein|nr:DUF2723 domain-containing protein [Chloroflexota bacterium]